jgi:hypothetical protein
MAGIVKGSIDLTKIPREKIVEGKKGKYLNVVVTINDEVDQYGNNASITVDQTPEERQAKEAKTYLGNAKIVWSNGNMPSPPPRDGQAPGTNFPAATPQAPVAANDDLPF